MVLKYIYEPWFDKIMVSDPEKAATPPLFHNGNKSLFCSIEGDIKGAYNFQIEEKNALRARIWLFLKGAANNTTPLTLTLSVEVSGRAISTRDLSNIYGLVTSNAYLRRLAGVSRYRNRHLCQKKWSERRSCSKDRDLSPRGKGLNPFRAEKLPDAATFPNKFLISQRASGRLSTLLAADYTKRLSAKSNTGGRKNNDSENKTGNKRSKPKVKGANKRKGKAAKSPKKK